MRYLGPSFSSLQRGGEGLVKLVKEGGRRERGGAYSAMTQLVITGTHLAYSVSISVSEGIRRRLVVIDMKGEEHTK
jgi:hypothetical protein